MPRPIDHLVLPVSSLPLARSRLTSLGFTVAPDARHPFGTGNCCVFFGNGTYLEPIATLDRAAAEAAASDGLFFVERLKFFTERHGDGFAMLALRSSDAEADHRAFEKAGMSAGPLFRFARMAALPDGSEQEIGVALAYLADEAAPDATFFRCQRINTDALWSDAFISHPNGALGVAGVTAVAENPADFRRLLAAATGQAELGKSTEALTASGERQSVAIVTPEGFRARYGLEPPDPQGGLRLAGFDVEVADLDRATGYAGPTAMRHDGAIVVPASTGLDAALAFRTPENG